VELRLRRLCFLLSSLVEQNGFVGRRQNFLGTGSDETASRTREVVKSVRKIDISAATKRRSLSEPGAEGPGLDRLPRETGSDESESQKAGAEQGDPTGSQGQEAVGNEISISHDTPSDFRCSTELIKSFGTSHFERSDTRTPPRSRPRADNLERMGEEDSGTDQSHHRSHCLEHCKTSLARP
jgi:hypothetical protein